MFGKHTFGTRRIRVTPGQSPRRSQASQVLNRVTTHAPSSSSRSNRCLMRSTAQCARVHWKAHTATNVGHEVLRQPFARVGSLACRGSNAATRPWDPHALRDGSIGETQTVCGRLAGRCGTCDLIKDADSDAFRKARWRRAAVGVQPRAARAQPLSFDCPHLFVLF